MTAPNPDSPPRSDSGGGSNFWTRKLGPLPMWAWIAIGSALLVIVYSYKKNQSTQNQSTDTGVDSSQIPQFINQTYVNTQPPDGSTTTTPPTTTTPTPVTGTKLGQSSGGHSGDLPGGTYGFGVAGASGDNSIATLAKHFGISQSTFEAWNPEFPATGTVPAGTKFRVPEGKARSMTVIRTGGQWSTIPRIARHFGVTAQQLIAANPIISSQHWDVHNLPPGEVLTVPQKG